MKSKHVHLCGLRLRRESKQEDTVSCLYIPIHHLLTDFKILSMAHSV